MTNNFLVALSRLNAEQAGVADRVRFINADLFETDLSEASVVTLYLLGSLNQRLLPKLRKELKPGSRIVSHAFTMGDEWKPDAERTVNGKTIYHWNQFADKLIGIDNIPPELRVAQVIGPEWMWPNDPRVAQLESHGV